MVSSWPRTAWPAWKRQRARSARSLQRTTCTWSGQPLDLSTSIPEEVEQAIHDAIKVPGVKPSCHAPDPKGIRTTLAPKVTEAMKKCYESALPFGLNQQINQQHHPFISDFLLLGWSQKTAGFLEIDQMGQMNWHTVPKFAAVGSGGEFATVAQALMRHHVEGREVTIDDGLLIAYRAIETTCGVSSSGVGLPVWLATSTDKGARVLDRAEIDKVETEVLGWKQLEIETLTAFRAKPEEGESAGPEDPPSLDPSSA